MAVTIAGQKIHRPVAVMSAQALVHQTRILDKLGPFERGDGAHADDDVADRRIIGDLVGVFPMHDFIEADTLFVQPVIQEIEGECGARMRVVQTLQDLDCIRLTHGGGG